MKRYHLTPRYNYKACGGFEVRYFISPTLHLNSRKDTTTKLAVDSRTQAMGHWVVWSVDDCSYLAWAWFMASEDPIVGVDQTTVKFFNVIFNTFFSDFPLQKQTKNSTKVEGFVPRVLNGNLYQMTVQSFAKRYDQCKNSNRLV